MRLAQFLDGGPQAWTEQDRSEVARHFAPAAESLLLGPTGNGERAVIWALVRWLFVDDDNPHDGKEEDEDVKDKEEALCVLGPGLYNAAVVFGRDCPLPELCGEECDERVLAVSRRLWARVLVAANTTAAQDQREGKSAAVVSLLGGILLMFRLLLHTGAARDGSNGTLDESGLDAFDDRFTSCLLNHPHTTVVLGAMNFVATSAPFFRMLPLTQGPEDISSSRTFRQLRRLFHGAADPLVRCAALHTLVRLQCPGFVQDVVERCAQETDADVLTQIYRAVSYCHLTASSLEPLVEAAPHGLNHCDARVVSAAISMVDRIGDLYRGRGRDVDELYYMIAMAVSRLFMSSEPGVKSLVRLTAARVAAFDERSWTLATRNGVLLERLPQELHDLLGACRTTLQLQEKCTNQRDVMLPIVISQLSDCEPLWRALSKLAASRLVRECSWQLRESGLMLLEVMVRVWNDDKIQAFVEEHWPFLVATLNDPVAQVRRRCCQTITELLASTLPIKQDHDRVSCLVDEGLLVLFSSELSRNGPARAPTTADDATPEPVFVQALDLLRQLAKNETQLTEAAVERAFVGFLACIAHIPLARQPDLVKCVVEWFQRDKAPRAKLACAALVATSEEHLRSHDMGAICAALAFLVALWPHMDEDSRSSAVQCAARVLSDRGLIGEVASSTVQGLIQQCPDLQERVSAALGWGAADL